MFWSKRITFLYWSAKKHYYTCKEMMYITYYFFCRHTTYIKLSILLFIIDLPDILCYLD